MDQVFSKWIKPAMFLMLTAIGFSCPAYGIILYSGDNAANQTAPDIQRENSFNSVARVCDANGGGNFGSAVHIKGKYLLTAGHVSVQSHVTFDGTTLYAHDTDFTPMRIGNADMKLIKLVDDPMLPDIELNADGLADVNVNATVIGWGLGRNEDADDTGFGLINIWAWGSPTTIAKRWGTNRVDGVDSLQYGSESYGVLVTNLDSNFTGQGNEAAVALFDSGSGLFAEIDNQWKLIGVTTAVSRTDASTFSFLNGDKNFFARVSTYAAEIEAAIPDTSTLSGWKVDHGLYGADAENTADTDGDGINQLLEFALGGDPNENNQNILPTSRLIKDDDDEEEYLEITLTCPKGLQGIDYIPQTTTDLSNWPEDSTGINIDTPKVIDNEDGTETVTYRRTQPVTAFEKAFIRIVVKESM